MPNPLALSDEDFAKSGPPVVEQAGADSSSTGSVEETAPVVEDANPQAPSGTTPENSDAGQNTGTSDADQLAHEKDEKSGQGETAAKEGDKPPETVTATGQDQQAPQVGDPAGVPPLVPKEPLASDNAPDGPVDYEAFYKQVMAPFKANGKTIQLRDVGEAIQLMQQGANFTRKMQDIAPHRKLLMMLDNNGLLDSDKLSFLIDLDKKNPEAIKKLIKDSGIDPMDFDPRVEPAYQAGNHQVTDEQVAFDTALKEVASSSDGQNTLRIINSEWDQASKDVLWKNPQVLTVIHSQRENGIYDRIANEVTRLRTIGTIPANVAFIEAYRAVGDNMAKVGAFNDLAPQPMQQGAPRQSAPAYPPAAAPVPVATRVATPPAPVANSTAALAASPSRSTPQRKEAIVNPLSMSDDDFLAKMKNRL